MIAKLPGVIALVESGWHSVRVLVVGDVMLDKYIWGDVERISPEAPVPVVRATWHNERPGGAANVALNLAGLGACVTVAGFAGGDDEQRRLESMLAEAGVEPALTEVEAIPTTTKLRIFSGNQQMMRLDTEAAPSPSNAAYTNLLKGVSTALPNADVVVLSDYAKGVLTEAVCRSIIAQAGKLGIPVLVDPKQRDFSRCSCVGAYHSLFPLIDGLGLAATPLRPGGDGDRNEDDKSDEQLAPIGRDADQDEAVLQDGEDGDDRHGDTDDDGAPAEQEELTKRC